MTTAEKNELEDLARELLSKVGTLMTPASIDLCESILEEWAWRRACFSWSLVDPEDAKELRLLKVLYFSQLIAA